jgi:hypothetical protein
MINKIKASIKKWLERRRVFKLLKKLNKRLYGKIDMIEGVEIEIYGLTHWRNIYKERMNDILKNKDRYLKTYSKEYVENLIKEYQKEYDIFNNKCTEIGGLINALMTKLKETP